jgi:triacylglycerol lipase
MAAKQPATTRGSLESATGLPLWREAFVVRDWLSLRMSLVYNGFGVPHGDGSPVVVVPGFLGSDRYLMEFYHWLKRVGYRPYYSSIGVNAECPDVLMRRLLATVNRARSENRRKVRLVGHSLGGTIARTLAARRPEAVAQVITLASPIRAARVHPAILKAADVVRARSQGDGTQPDTCYTVGCTCSFVSSVGDTPPPSVSRTAIYTKSDGIVDWRCCLDEDEQLNIEVKGTHAGLAFNPGVYRTVARLLAEVKVEPSSAGARKSRASRRRAGP